MNNNNHNPRRACQHPAILRLLTAAGMVLLGGLYASAAGASDQVPAAQTTTEAAVPVPPIDEARLTRQRALYEKAEQALKQRHYHRFKKLAAQLQDYPLYSYLQYQYLKKNLDRLPRRDLNAFLDANHNTVLGQRFRHYLLRHYARKHRWQDFIDIYDNRQGSSLHCTYLDALLKTGAREQALSRVESLWLSGSSRPAACDPVFAAWEKDGRLTQELIWKRIELAMARGHTRLARYIGRKLTSRSDREVIYLWSQIHRRPQLIIPASRLEGHPMASTIRLHAVERMARRDADEAITLWQELQQRHSFSDLERQQAIRSIGIRLARQHHPEAIRWLSRIPAAEADERVNEWLIRSAIRQGDWQRVAASIERLPLTQQSGLRWQFWWAYAHEQLGHRNDAEGIYRYLAGRRSYYGFLAADRLGLPYSFENRPLSFNGRELAVLGRYPAVLRARELFRLNHIIDARREWNHLTRSLNTREKLAASQLAHSWDWHDRAIFTMGRTDYRDDIALRFPLPMKATVESYSQERSIDPAWTYAIIRRESAFMRDARSSAGALGLMQIMPGTARHVARRMKLHYRGRHSLLHWDTNIRLGTGYLEQMLKRLDSQAVLATAAYNAGPHRVEAWLPEGQPMDAIRWVETIPFQETREYVSNVLAYTIIYQHVMSNNYTRLAHHMPPVPARDTPAQTAQVDDSTDDGSS